MIGLIVTGHGAFASGITSGLKLLTGEPENYAAVDFEPEDSIEDLTEKVKRAVRGIDSQEGILILTDIAGGSPFNVSLRIKLEGPGHYEVLGGANLPAVLEAYMLRREKADVHGLACSVCEAARNQIICHETSEGGEDKGGEGSDAGFEE